MKSFPLTPIGQTAAWSVEMEPENLLLTPPTDDPSGRSEPLRIAHEDRSESVEVIGLIGNQSVLVIHDKVQSRKYQFRLSPQERQWVDGWFGPPTQGQLSLALKRRYSFALPIAVIFIFTSMPRDASPDQGFEAVPGDPISALLGFALLGLWVIARFRPSPYLFLADSLWFFLVALKLVAGILLGGASPLWLFCLVLIAPILLSGWGNFRRFAQYSPSAASVPTETPNP